METSATHNRFLAIARIARPQGRRGEVAAEILTDFPERRENLRRVWLASPDGEPAEMPRKATIESAWPHKGRMILKFAGVDSIDAANGLRGLHVLILREDRAALADHRYYVWELEGCEVVDGREDGAHLLGTVISVEPTGGVDLLHVARPAGGEVLIPLAQEICTRIDVAAKTIVVSPPEDLLDLNE